MPNPGAFQGSRKEFLMGEKKEFARGVLTSSVGEALGVIQRCYFKQYPIDLPHNEEPSPEHLAAVDDDAPDPDIAHPEETTMTPEEYSEAMARIAERQQNIKKRKAQIKHWFIYQYMKDHNCDPRDRRAWSPYGAFLAKICGDQHKRPRRKSACNVWHKLHHPAIESQARLIVLQEGTPRARLAALRDRIACEMFCALSLEEQKDWSDTAQSEHEEAVREWKELQDQGPSTASEDRQCAIQGLVRFVQPVLDIITDSTGWQVSLFAGGPEPAMEGMLNVISVHSGTTSGDIKLTFGQAERQAIRKDIIPTFGHYLRNCYTLEECQAGALAEGEGFVPISEMELEGSTGLIHSLSDDPTPSDPPTTLSTASSRAIQPSPPANSATPTSAHTT